MEEEVEFGLARSRVTGLRTFFLQALLAQRKLLRPQLARATHKKVGVKIQSV